MAALFQAGGELTPGSPAFSDVVYRRLPTLPNTALDAVHFRPQVICSPRLSGKTTQVNNIAECHRRLGGRLPVTMLFCVLPAAERGLDEQWLRHFLAERLSSSPHGALTDILETSPLLGRGRTVLAVINSECLADAALRWLLAGFRSISEDEEGDFAAGLQVQLLIDGSFAVETLTSGPDSDYPLTQAYPSEFTADEQRLFVASRLERLRLTPDADGLACLWERTLGDKYLTQAVGQFLERDAPPGGRRRVVCGARVFSDALEQRDVWHDLFKATTTSAVSLSLKLALDHRDPAALGRVLAGEWGGLSHEFKAVAYDGGLVRRTGQQSAVPRAPLVADHVDAVAREAARHLAFLQSQFSVHGVARRDRARAIAVVEQIVQSAAAGTLITAHVGHGQVAGDGVAVTATTVEGGTYSAVWMVPTDGYAPAAPVWALSWTTCVNGGRRTEQQLFAVEPIIS